MSEELFLCRRSSAGDMVLRFCWGFEQAPSIAALFIGWICSPPAQAYVSMTGPQRCQGDAACCVAPVTLAKSLLGLYKGNSALHGVLWVLLPTAQLEAKGVPETLLGKWLTRTSREGLQHDRHSQCVPSGGTSGTSR